MFRTIEPALVDVWTSTGNFEKGTDDTIKILQLVHEASSYKSLGDKQDSVLAWIPNERQLHAFFIVFCSIFKNYRPFNKCFQNKYAEFLKKSLFFLDESIYNLV